MSSSQRLSPQVILLLAALYGAQGLPSGLMAHALPTLMRQQGVDLAVIGLLKLLALPWLLKALWAPWVDRYGSARLGHHRGWILPLQGLVVVLLLTLAWLPVSALFGAWLPLLIGLLLLINLAAATQDIATDGLAVRLLPPRWRGLGNSLQVGGYKIGMILSGSLLLLVIEDWGWPLTLSLLALLVAILLVPALLFPEQRVLPVVARAQEPAGPGLLWRHYRGFLAQPGIAAWLAVVLTFKLGDALGSPMIKPLLVDQGWTTPAIGQLTLLTSVAGIGGALLGGLLYARLGGLWSLLGFGALQAVGIGALAVVAATGGNFALVYGVATFEQIADGMSTVALFAVMMNQCRLEHEGADYTVQASIQLILAGVVGALSGVLAKALGYQGLFLGAAGIGLLSLLLVVRFYHKKKEPRGS